MLFRFSPVARCPCKHTDKSYWKCCWAETARHDATAELRVFQTLAMKNPVMTEFGKPIIERIQQARANGEDLDQSLFPALDSVDKKQGIIDLIRSSGCATIVSGMMHPNSQISTWNADVYAGCIERLDNYFFCKFLRIFLLDSHSFFQGMIATGD